MGFEALPTGMKYGESDARCLSHSVYIHIDRGSASSSPNAFGFDVVERRAVGAPSRRVDRTAALSGCSPAIGPNFPKPSLFRCSHGASTGT
jgi:hypothetical protein